MTESRVRMVWKSMDWKGEAEIGWNKTGEDGTTNEESPLGRPSLGCCGEGIEYWFLLWSSKGPELLQKA